MCWIRKLYISAVFAAFALLQGACAIDVVELEGPATGTQFAETDCRRIVLQGDVSLDTRDLRVLGVRGAQAEELECVLGSGGFLLCYGGNLGHGTYDIWISHPDVTTKKVEGITTLSEECQGPAVHLDMEVTPGGVVLVSRTDCDAQGCVSTPL